MHSIIENRILEKYNKQITQVGNITLPSFFPVHGAEVAPRYKAVTAGDGSSIWYDDVPHLYFKQYPNGIRMPMISVTTIIHAYSKPFDEEGMSYRCALKDDYDCKCLDRSDWYAIGVNVRKERIKKAWKANSRNASEYGTFAHAVMEGVTVTELSTSEVYLEQSRKYGMENEVVMSFADDFHENVLLHDISRGYTVIAEPLVFDLGAMICGQSDLVVLDTVNKIIYIKDFKTNETRPDRAKAYSKMEGILSHLDDYAYSHYCIQLCLYQRMVQSVLPGYILGNNTLLWLNRETGEIEELLINPMDWAFEINSILYELGNLKQKIYEFYQVDRLVGQR